jgi:hypothetical protein
VISNIKGPFSSIKGSPLARRLVAKRVVRAITESPGRSGQLAYPGAPRDAPLNLQGAKRRGPVSTKVTLGVNTPRGGAGDLKNVPALVSNRPPELSAATYRHFASVAANRGFGNRETNYLIRARGASENPLPIKAGWPHIATDGYGNKRFDLSAGGQRYGLSTGRYNAGDTTHPGGLKTAGVSSVASAMKKRRRS